MRKVGGPYQDLTFIQFEQTIDLSIEQVVKACVLGQVRSTCLGVAQQLIGEHWERDLARCVRVGEQVL